LGALALKTKDMLAKSSKKRIGKIMAIDWKISQNSNRCVKKVISIVGSEDIDGEGVRISEHQMLKFIF
jgi:hypothetical protein